MKPRVVWDGTQFQIPDQLISIWRKAYPNVALESEFAKAAAWIVSNQPKKNYARFLNGWLAKAKPVNTIFDGGIE